jgi:hypothetical protein
MTITIFKLGDLLSTPAALAALFRSGQTPLFFLARHARGDWGDVDVEDWKANDAAVRAGDRILSAYKTLTGETLWVITEANRSVTTILMPAEY